MQVCPALLCGGSPSLLQVVRSAIAVALHSPGTSGHATLTAGKPLPGDFAVPDHSIEEGLPEISVLFRQDSGSRFVARIRKNGGTPAALSKLPKNFFLPLTMDSKEAARHVRNFGRAGICARVFKLLWTHPHTGSVIPIRALPRVVHINSQTLALENISFAFCPPEAEFDIDVPIQLWNSDMAPGVKKGGWLHVVNRTARLRCPGSHIPQRLELDMRHMGVHDIVRLKDLNIPEGCRLNVPDPEQPVVRCTIKVGGD